MKTVPYFAQSNFKAYFTAYSVYEIRMLTIVECKT